MSPGQLHPLGSTQVALGQTLLARLILVAVWGCHDVFAKGLDGQAEGWTARRLDAEGCRARRMSAIPLDSMSGWPRGWSAEMGQYRP